MSSERDQSREDVKANLSVLSSLAAAGCALIGAVSLIDSADGWQDVLTAIHSRLPAGGCPGDWTVPGWGDGTVLALTALTMLLLAVTTLGGFAPRFARLGGATALAALVPLTVLWLDATTVAHAPLGDCDGIGLGGGASAAINRAGWFCVAAVVLSLLARALLSRRAPTLALPPARRVGSTLRVPPLPSSSVRDRDL